jgi:hypothetical protein
MKGDADGLNLIATIVVFVVTMIVRFFKNIKYWKEQKWETERQNEKDILSILLSQNLPKYAEHCLHSVPFGSSNI